MIKESTARSRVGDKGKKTNLCKREKIHKCLHLNKF